MSLLVLSSSDVDKITNAFTHTELTDLMASVFVKVSRKLTDDPPRLSVPTKNHRTLFMPSTVADTGTGIKIVSVPTSEIARPKGIASTTLMIDTESGVAQAVVNSRSLTALRTAAGSLLATKLVGPKTPLRIVVFGSGLQILAHVRLHLEAYPSITHCAILVRSIGERVTDLVSKLREQFPAVTFASDVPDIANETKYAEIVHSADVICCATPSTKPLLRSSWVRDGTHVNLVGSYTPEMCEIPPDLVRRAVRILVDSKEAAMKEAGDLIQAKIGLGDLIEMGELYQLADDGALIEDREKLDPIASISPGKITLFKSVGIGAQDIAISDAALRRAMDMNLGTMIADYDE